MFLVPQLFQHLNRCLESGMRSERALSLSFPYGVVKAQVDESQLQRGVVEFRRLLAVMPGGTVIDHRAPAERGDVEAGSGEQDSNADLPARPIGSLLDGKESVRFWLALPGWGSDGVNLSSDAHASSPARYRREEREVSDPFTGERRRAPLLTLRAQLLVEDQIRPGYERMPLLQVRRAANRQAGYQVDPRYVPPCMMISGWTPLLDWADERARMLAGRRDAQHKACHGPALSKDPLQSCRQVLKLAILGRGTGRFDALMQAPAATPWDIYASMEELVNELQALEPRAGSCARPRYDHDDPLKALEDMGHHLDALSRPDGGAKVVTAEFRREGAWWKCQLSDAFLANQPWHLVIASKETEAKVVENVTLKTQFKLMCPVNEQERGTYGWVLEHAPREGGSAPGCFFRLDEANTASFIKKRTREKRELWLEWSGSPFEFTPTLRVVVADGT
jgi:type VI secretion system protein ImpJ